MITFQRARTFEKYTRSPRALARLCGHSSHSVCERERERDSYMRAGVSAPIIGGRLIYFTVRCVDFEWECVCGESGGMVCMYMPWF